MSIDWLILKVCQPIWGLCLEVKELCAMYAYIYNFCVVVSD